MILKSSGNNSFFFGHSTFLNSARAKGALVFVAALVSRAPAGRALVPLVLVAGTLIALAFTVLVGLVCSSHSSCSRTVSEGCTTNKT